MRRGSAGGAGPALLHLFKDYNHAIRHSQVVQEQPGAVILKVVKAPRFDEPVLEEGFGILRRYLGQQMRIDVQFVESIPMGRTGKRQVSLSWVTVDFQSLPGAAGQGPEA